MFTNGLESIVDADIKAASECERVGELTDTESVNNGEREDVESFSPGGCGKWT